MPQPIGVAYPWKKTDREHLRQALGGKAIPRVKPGSVLRRCYRCHIPIAVGPRLEASGLKVVCAMCAHVLGMEGF
jgi:hypothetical protein